MKVVILEHVGGADDVYWITREMVDEKDGYIHRREQEKMRGYF